MAGLRASSRVECPDRWLAGQFAVPTEVWPHGTLNPAYDSCIPPRPSSKHKVRKVVHDTQLLPPHHVWRSEVARAARELAVRINNDAKNSVHPAGAAEVHKERFRRLADKANRRRPPFAGTGVPPPNAHARQVYSIPADRLYSVSPLRKQANSRSAEKIRVWRQGTWTTDLVAKQKVASHKRAVHQGTVSNVTDTEVDDTARSAQPAKKSNENSGDERGRKQNGRRRVARKQAKNETERHNDEEKNAKAGRLVAEVAESERLFAEEDDATRLAAEEAEASRLAAEEAEASCLAAEEAEAGRLAAEEAEARRLATEEVDAARSATEVAQFDPVKILAPTALDHQEAPEEEADVGELARKMSRERAKTGVTHRARERQKTEVLVINDENDVLYSVVSQYPRRNAEEGDMEDDLYFDSGAIINVLQEGVEGWGDEWAIGRLADTVATAPGFFPLNFTRRLTEEEQDAERDRVAENRQRRVLADAHTDT